MNRQMRCSLKIFRLQLSLAATIAATGCTQLPLQEFAQYRQAFEQAQVAGEEVVLDWAAADAKVKALRRSEDGATEGWSYQQVEARVRPSDHVGARLEAWKVIAQYNELLLALAEGRKAQELAAGIGTLAESLDKFPWSALGDKVATIAASAGVFVGPAVELVRTLAEEAQREADRRKFVEAVQAATPLIRLLIVVMKEDSNDFWNVRNGLIDREYVRLLSRIATRLVELREILEKHEDPGQPVELDDSAADDEDRLRNQAATLLSMHDAELRTLTEYKSDGIGTIKRIKAPREIDAKYVRAIRSLVQESDALIIQASELRHQFSAYSNMLSDYVVLLVVLGESLDRLEVAATNAPRQLPPIAELRLIAGQIRSAIEVYEKARM